MVACSYIEIPHVHCLQHGENFYKSTPLISFFWPMNDDGKLIFCTLKGMVFSNGREGRFVFVSVQ